MNRRENPYIYLLSASPDDPEAHVRLRITEHLDGIRRRWEAEYERVVSRLGRHASEGFKAYWRMETERAAALERIEALKQLADFYAAALGGVNDPN